MASSPYDRRFYDRAVRSGEASASRIISILRGMAPITSVLDVGCARGTWLSEWARSGTTEIHGVDYPPTAPLKIPPANFTAANLASGFDLGRTFALVQSLEVAEHLPPEAADCFVDALIGHSSGLILFSAAVPGQGGEGHVNERPLEYWRGLFRGRGFRPIDCLRPIISADKAISYWYRYNIMLYARPDTWERLSPEVREFTIPDSQRKIRDYSPLSYRLRRQVIRLLPKRAVDAIARRIADTPP